MQALQYLNSNDLRGFTDLINCEDVEAGGREREEPLRGAGSVLTVRLGGSARLTDRTLALLARNCPSLTRLELQRCRNVTNGGILDLMTRCPRIQHLDLTGN